MESLSDDEEGCEDEDEDEDEDDIADTNERNRNNYGETNDQDNQDGDTGDYDVDMLQLGGEPGDPMPSEYNQRQSCRGGNYSIDDDSNGSSTSPPDPSNAASRENQLTPLSITRARNNSASSSFGIADSFTTNDDDHLSVGGGTGIGGYVYSNNQEEYDNSTEHFTSKTQTRQRHGIRSRDEDALRNISTAPAAATAQHHHSSTTTDTTTLLTTNFTSNPPNTITKSNYGLLERCGRWLMSIPRDDVVALQCTAEYRDFLLAFDRLGEAHRRTVMLERRQLMEREEDDMADYAAAASSHRFSTVNDNNNVVDKSLATAAAAANVFSPVHHISYNHLYLQPSSSSEQEKQSQTQLLRPQQLQTPHTQQEPQQQPTTPQQLQNLPPTPRTRRRYSFLQHLAVDDVLLRIFEFIDCFSLVRTGTTCHRFHELTLRSAEQRTHRLADGRLLRSAMKMLRAQEQIDGVGPREEGGPFVPIPILGLRRRVKVTGAGDREYNGIYFCTGSNGNGFLFTKPRVPDRRVMDYERVVRLMAIGMGAVEFPMRHGGGANAIAADVRVGAGALGENADVAANGEEEENADDAQREADVDVLFGDEPNRSRLLRCVIAKRFSNEVCLCDCVITSFESSLLTS